MRRLLTVSLLALAAVAQPGAALVLAGEPGSQESESTAEVSPLPPPATRAGLRGRWFEFLSALSEDDFSSAQIALADLLKTAERVGISRLSDFSRAALYEARRAEHLAKWDRATAAFDAAVRLDPDLFDARWERVRFFLSRHQNSQAVIEAANAVSALVVTHESRRELVSNTVILAGVAWALASMALVICLLVRHIRRILHDVRETAERVFGGKGAIALAVVFLGLPLWLSFGPFWLFLYWAVLLFVYGEPKERGWLAIALAVGGLIGPVFEEIADLNVIARSPLVSAAVDLAERKEEGGSVDLLHRAAAVFPEDPDVWYLLGRFAQRREDYEEASEDYARALKVNPQNFRCMIARGNIHFWEGDLGQAIQDYRDALQVRPQSALAYFNLSLAQGDAYLFDQQRQSLASARALAPREVDRWIESPTLGRVVSLDYSVREAVERTRRWGRQSKSQVLPGIHQPPTTLELFASPLILGPWLALVAGLILAGVAQRRGFGASECTRCGRAFCSRCKLSGAAPLFCMNCVRLYVRKEGADIQSQVAHSEETRRQQRVRRRERRLLSLFLPGARRVSEGLPGSGFAVLYVFFFLLAGAFLTASLFPVRSVPSAPVFPTREVAAASLAFLIWLASNIKTLRT
jgi:tetratricopeptide (TPR) repeat protein